MSKNRNEIADLPVPCYQNLFCKSLSHYPVFQYLLEGLAGLKPSKTFEKIARGLSPPSFIQLLERQSQRA